MTSLPEPIDHYPQAREIAGYWHDRGWWRGFRATAAVFFTAGMLVAWAIEGGTFGDCRAPKAEATP